MPHRSILSACGPLLTVRIEPGHGECAQVADSRPTNGIQQIPKLHCMYASWRYRRMYVDSTRTDH